MINFFAATLVTLANLTANSSFSWVCDTLDSNPTVDGMWEVVWEGVERGQTSDSDAEQIVIQIRDRCPEYIPIVKEWAEQNG